MSLPTTPTWLDTDDCPSYKSNFTVVSSRSKSMMKRVSTLFQNKDVMFGRSKTLRDERQLNQSKASSKPVSLKSRNSRHSRRRSITVRHIADSLPRIQSNCAEAFHILYYWLKDNELDKREKKKFSTELWYKLYLALPDMKDSSFDFTFAGDKIVSVFEWLLRDFVSSRQAYGKVERRIHSMCECLSKYIDITPHNCDIVLEAFHHCFGKYYGDRYSLSIRVAFTRVFALAVDLSNGSLDYSTQLLHSFLSSFEDCLDNPIGRSYFEQFVREQMCDELMDFLHEWRGLSGVLSSSVRLKKVKSLVKQFIESGSPSQINIPGRLRIDIVEAYQVCIDEGAYRRNGVLDIYFERALAEVLRLLRTNFWRSFVNEICKQHGVDKNQFVRKRAVAAVNCPNEIVIPQSRPSTSASGSSNASLLASPRFQQLNVDSSSSFAVGTPLCSPSHRTTPTPNFDAHSPLTTAPTLFDLALDFGLICKSSRPSTPVTTPVGKRHSKLFT